MTTINKYKVYCLTDSKWEYIWDTSEPTVCPSNNAHTINNDSISIIEKISQNQITIREETTPTGGRFNTFTMKVDAKANSTSYSTKTWPFPISALAIGFTTTSDHTGDCFDVVVGKNTIIGVLTANVNSATAWTAQNYTAGDVVTYNSLVYTCILNTVSNEIPTNTVYWKVGLRVSVSLTVIQNTAIGFYINLFDGVNSDDLGRVISINTQYNYLYVETNSTNNFLASTPTYVRQSVYTVKEFEIGAATIVDIGGSKIGGSYLPANVSVTIEYMNKHATLDKIFIGRADILY